jgi:AraC-like DNA-binding protein
MILKQKMRAAVTELNAFSFSSGKTAAAIVDERDFYSLSYRYKGRISIEDGEKALISEGGSITFIPKGLSYRTEVLEDTQMAVIHFKLARDIDFRNAAVFETQDAELRLLFERLVRNFRVDAPLDFRCMSVFYELLAKLERTASEDGIHVPEKIRRAKKYIAQNYQSPQLSIEGVAGELGVSTAYLRREFSRAYGLSPIAFLRNVRIGNAKNMLASGYLSIEAIAAQCGFSGTGYFIQVFHKAVGDSPDRYRRRLRG